MDGEPTCDPVLPGMVLFSVNQKLAEREGRLTEECKRIKGVLVIYTAVLICPVTATLRMLEEAAPQSCPRTHSGDGKGQEATPKGDTEGPCAHLASPP